MCESCGCGAPKKPAAPKQEGEKDAEKKGTRSCGTRKKQPHLESSPRGSA